MKIIVAIAGICCLGITLLDFIQSTLSLRGSGPITQLTSRFVWRTSLKLCKMDGHARPLEHVGHMNVVFIILFWVLGGWLGLFLLLLSDPYSVLQSATMSPATVIQKFSFAGAVLSTTGSSDLQSNGALWIFLNPGFSFVGLALITIAITFLVPVITAVNFQRSLSLYINSIGNTPQQIVINSWNGQDFSRLFNHVSPLTNMLIQHSHNHLVYPVIHYFHSTNPKTSIVISIAMLEEAVLILTKAVAQSVQPADKDITMLKEALQYYLETVHGLYVLPECEERPMPELSDLEKEGIPLQPEAQHQFVANRQLEKRRSVYAMLLANSGWSWKHVYSAEKRNSPLSF